MNTRLKKGGMVLAIVVATVGTWEGLRTVAYRDPVGIPTVCFGETRGVHMGDRYTEEECKVMLGDRLIEFEQEIRRCLTKPDEIPDKTYAAFISFAYNVGSGAFCRSTLHRKANEGDLVGACNELMKWTKAGGRTLQGLVNRRKAERKLCLEGVREGIITKAAEALEENSDVAELDSESDNPLSDLGVDAANSGNGGSGDGDSGLDIGEVTGPSGRGWYWGIVPSCSVLRRSTRWLHQPEGEGSSSGAPSEGPGSSGS